VAVAILLALLTAAPAQAGRYVVRWGDTLTWIAQDHHIGLKRLAHMNHRNPFAVLVAGTVLRVPGLSVSAGPAKAGYTVQWGDTLTGIAARYHVGLGRLARANGLRVRGILISGTTLRIPGHGSVRARGIVTTTTTARTRPAGPRAPAGAAATASRPATR
jgi:LysM repeat protein